MKRNGQCIVTKDRAPEEAGTWTVEEGKLGLYWDKWRAEGLEPCPSPSPPGCFEYPEHRFSLDFGALQHEWCPIKACRHGEGCRFLECTFWHPEGSWHAQKKIINDLRTKIEQDKATLEFLRADNQGEDRLRNFVIGLEAKEQELQELQQQLH